jgi:hypothetical protein
MTATKNDVVLVGGPRDGDTVEAGGAGLLELDVSGMVHRYIPTKQTRPMGDAELQVYNYDGMLNPAGAEDGVESAGRRASPVAEEASVTTSAYLHGGRLDGMVRETQTGPDGQPGYRVEFELEAEGGLWYIEYQREQADRNGWHFQATGNEERADEE